MFASAGYMCYTEVYNEGGIYSMPYGKISKKQSEILEYINVILLRLTKEKVKYANCINIVENTKKRLKQNANYDMCIDNMIFNMWEEVNWKTL